MKTYTLPPASIREFLRRWLILIVIIILVTLILYVFGSHGFSPNTPNLVLAEIGSVSLIRVISTGVFVLLAIGFLWFSLARKSKKLKTTLASVEIDVGQNFVARRQTNIPRLVITRDEISYAEETGSALCIHANDKSRTLTIPKRIDGYNEIRDTLSGWNVQVRHSGQYGVLLTIVIITVILGAFAIVLFVNDFWTSFSAWLGLLAIYAYYYWWLENAKGVDPNLRQSRGVLLGIVAILGLLKFIGPTLFALLVAK